MKSEKTHYSRDYYVPRSVLRHQNFLKLVAFWETLKTVPTEIHAISIRLKTTYYKFLGAMYEALLKNPGIKWR